MVGFGWCCGCILGWVCELPGRCGLLLNVVVIAVDMLLFCLQFRICLVLLWVWCSDCGCD